MRKVFFNHTVLFGPKYLFYTSLRLVLANKKVKVGDQMVHQDTLKSKKIPGIAKDSAYDIWYCILTPVNPKDNPYFLLLTEFFNCKLSLFS